MGEIELNWMRGDFFLYFCILLFLTHEIMVWDDDEGCKLIMLMKTTLPSVSNWIDLINFFNYRVFLSKGCHLYKIKGRFQRGVFNIFSIFWIKIVGIYCATINYLKITCMKQCISFINIFFSPQTPLSLVRGLNG